MSPEIETEFLVPAFCRKTRTPFGIVFRSQLKGGYAVVGIRSACLGEGGVEGSRAQLTGLDFSSYPGCPHCGSFRLVLCSQCHTLQCEKPKTRIFFCRRCWHLGVIGGHFDTLTGSPRCGSEWLSTGGDDLQRP